MTTYQTKTFILAGRAIFTISNGKPAPDTRDYTFKVTRKELDSWDGRNPTTKKPVYFVSLLTGADNENDYQYLGVLDPDNGRVKVTAKSTFLPTSSPVVAIGWALGHIWAGHALPNGATLQHAGRCGKCARTLTVPESIESGLGPECSGLGYTKPRNERKPRTRKAPKPTFDQLRAAAAGNPADFTMGLPAAPAPLGRLDAQLAGATYLDGTPAFPHLDEPTPGVNELAEGLDPTPTLLARPDEAARLDAELEAERLLAVSDSLFDPDADNRAAAFAAYLASYRPMGGQFAAEDSVDRAERALGVQ